MSHNPLFRSYGEVELWILKEPAEICKEPIVSKYQRYRTGIPVDEFGRQFPELWRQLYAHLSRMALPYELPGRTSRRIGLGDLIVAGVSKQGAPVLGQVVSLSAYEKVKAGFYPHMVSVIRVSRDIGIMDMGLYKKRRGLS